jgi:hypothetical protein
MPIAGDAGPYLNGKISWFEPAYAFVSFAFPRDALMQFVHAFDAIFELTTVLRELLRYIVEIDPKQTCLFTPTARITR